MTPPTQDWRDFSRRWRDPGGLSIGLLFAGLLLAGLFLLLEVRLHVTEPALGEPPQAAEVRAIPSPPPVIAPRLPSHAVQTDDPGLVAAIKQEIISKRLRPSFDLLAKDVVAARDREALWLKIAAQLDSQVETLARGLAYHEHLQHPYSLLIGIAPIAPQLLYSQPEDQLDSLNANMLSLLFKSVEGGSEGAVVDDLLKDLRRVSQSVADHYQKEIFEKLGQTTGDKINAVREKEAVGRQRALEQAEVALRLTATTAKESAKALDRLEPTLKEGTESLNKARARKDSATATKAAESLRAQRPTVSTAHTALQKAETALKSAYTKLSAMPAIESAVEQSQKLIDKTLDRTDASLQATTFLKDDNFLEETRRAAKELRSLHEQAERVRLAVQLQLARERADRRYESMAMQTRDVSELGKLHAEAEAANDPSRRADAARRRDLAVNDLNALRTSLTKYSEDLQQIAESNKDAEGLEELRAKTQEVRGILKRAGASLSEMRYKEAADLYKEAAAAFARQDEEIQKLQVKCGMKEEANPARLARWLIERLHRDGKFAKAGQEFFEATYRASIKDRLLKRLDEGISRRLKAEQIDNAAALERLRREADLIFDTEILKATDAHKAFTRGLDAKLPPPEADPTLLIRDDGVVSGDAFRALKVQMNYTAGSICSSAVYFGTVNTFCAKTYKVVQPSQALRRLEHLNNESRLDRRDFFGPYLPLELPDDVTPAPVTESPVRAQAMLLSRSFDRGQTMQRKGAPGERGYRLVTAPRLPAGQITIDGRLDDWPTGTIALNPIVKGYNAGSVKTDTQSALVAFTNSELLLGFDVVDTTGRIENDKPLVNYWANDAVEIFIDSLNAKLPRPSEESTYQFVAFPFNHREDKTSGGYRILTSGGEAAPVTKHVPLPADVIRRAAVKTARGWSLELAIPLALLQPGKPVPGRMLGFNLRVDTGSDTYFEMTGQKKLPSSAHPELWGELLLLGTDAIPELVDGPAIVPGRPAHIRVTDPDMNRDDAELDRVTVLMGDTRIVLTETGKATGIFEARVPTRFGIGQAVKGTIDVQQGKRLTIEYLDLARSDGERNRRVILTAPVANLLRQVGK